MVFQRKTDHLDVVGAYTIKELSRSQAFNRIEDQLQTEVSILVYFACVCNTFHLIFYYRDTRLFLTCCLKMLSMNLLNRDTGITLRV